MFNATQPVFMPRHSVEAAFLTTMLAFALALLAGVTLILRRLQQVLGL